eukprot:TRINITY_DN23031_c1_g2_i1.p1 TRINITY_DN23031_c1_g2~~TRINITY_DN23031_c1_g2_i1.p1  ORF type:complete len:898 (+),score=265.92 TRINITY_DN23031_c1_g2_i1:288-2696(+)
MRILIEGVTGVDNTIVEYISMIQQFFYSQQQINSRDTHDWTQRMNSLFFAQVNSSSMLYYAAVMLHPYGTRWTAPHVYATVWCDVLKDGSRLFLVGENGPFMNPSKDHGNLLVDVFAIDTATGSPGGERLYLWNASVAGYETDYVTYTIDPRVGTMAEALGYGESRLIPQAQSERKAGPRLWHSPDMDFLYSYHNIDAIFVPPPAPHPWHSFRAVRVTVGYLSSAFQDVFTKHAKIEGTTILLVNRRNGRVLASTLPGFTVIPPECQGVLALQGERAEESGCYTNITAHFSDKVREAYDHLGTTNPGRFIRASVGGGEHFLRRAIVAEEKELIWLRPVSAVEGEVRTALYYLILFVLLVVVFDTATAVAEIVFIALPLKRLSKSISSIGRLQTGHALSCIDTYEGNVLMVREIRSLMVGMTDTIGRLTEFRTFMPHVVLEDDDGEADSPPPVTPPPQSQGGQAGQAVQGHVQEGDDEKRDDEALDVMTIGSRCSSERSISVSEDRAADLLRLYVAPKRNIALLSINVVRWNGTVGTQVDQALLLAHSELVSDVAMITGLKGGTLDSFQGDRFLVGWNTARRTTDFVSNSCTSSLDLHRALKKHKLSIAVCKGTGRVGTLGNFTARRFTVLSPLVAWVSMLEMFNKHFGLRVTTDEPTLVSVRSYCMYRVVNGLYSEKTHATVVLGEITHETHTRNTEWMYQLQDLESKDPFGLYNEFARLVIHQDWAAIGEVPRYHPLFDIFFKSYNKQEFRPVLLFSQGGVHDQLPHDGGPQRGGQRLHEDPEAPETPIATLVTELSTQTF